MIVRDLCDSFRKLASWTSGRLRVSVRFGVAFNEETITESILLKLAAWHSPRDLVIRSWTKPEEGKGTKATGGKPTGADWDFWFADYSGRGFHVRVQAKRQFDSGKYESLDGAGQQIVDLWNNRGRAVPIYVFYNDADGPHFTQSTTQFNAKRFQRSSMWGCSFAPLSGIPKKLQPTPAEIRWMRPWHCLVCPCEFNQSVHRTLPEAVRSAVQSIYAATIEEGDDRLMGLGNLSFEITANPPEWVALLETETPDKTTLDDQSEGKLAEYLSERSLRGVAIIREQESKEP